MTAREVESIGRRLRALLEQAIGRLVLAAIAFGGALAASELRQDLALPLFIGGVALALLGCTDLVRRECMLDEAAGDRDAYAIASVRRHTARLATMERRRDDAASIRRLLRNPERSVADRVEANREELERLAADLERDDLSFDPACAVLLDHLLLRPDESALFAPGRGAADVHSCVVQIEAGLRSPNRMSTGRLDALCGALRRPQSRQ